jgi:hypothetical protein
MNFTRRERDDTAGGMDVLAAAEERERGAALDNAEDILGVRVRSESLACVPCAEQFQWLEHAYARHRRRFDVNWSGRHRLIGGYARKLTPGARRLHTTGRERARPAIENPPRRQSACYSCTISARNNVLVNEEPSSSRKRRGPSTGMMRIPHCVRNDNPRFPVPGSHFHSPIFGSE